MTVLLLHGLGGDRSSPLDLFGPVVPPGEHLLALDVRGHGTDERITPPEAFALEALTADIAARTRSAQDAVGRLGEPVTVVGVSMGAAIALRLALQSETIPGSLIIDRAVFVRPAFTDDPLPENLLAFPVIGELLADRGPVEGEREFLATELFAQTLAESRLGAHALLEQFRSPRAAERFRRLIEIPRNAAFGAADDLGGLQLPTAIVWTERDPVHPVSVAELWMDELGGASSIPLPARDDDTAAYVEATRSGVACWLGWS
ncbi:alpha/beta fold hydrolase [Herbiconiux sp.]|uniref:alpha/beta fold hydrolase n=1 Tax=Herbiconiux sp. TaxID=1871186 RepID=UPI0025B94E9D|nr:alpha/beta fold hydrolase [Herbiconiux sp.]